MEGINRNINGNINIVHFVFNELNGIDNYENENENKGTSKEFIDSLKEIEIQEEGITCSICLDDFKKGEKCLKLPCKGNEHFFHDEGENCTGIKKWLLKQNTCPVCRTEFPLENNNTNDTNDANNILELDSGIRQLMENVLNNSIRIFNPQEIIENEEQRQFEQAIQASLEEQ